jgi:hypothetical protein
MNWIGPSKRERKENGYRIHGVNTRVSKERVPRPPKYVNTQDFQFWPARFVELQEREKYAHWKDVGYRKGGLEEGLEEEEEVEMQEENEKIDNAIPLTDAEMQEKDFLSNIGFSSWTKRDFVSFCKACEKYGRDSIESIASEIEGKTLEEVKAYSSVFWERYREINGIFR